MPAKFQRHKNHTHVKFAWSKKKKKKTRTRVCFFFRVGHGKVGGEICAIKIRHPSALFSTTQTPPQPAATAWKVIEGRRRRRRGKRDFLIIFFSTCMTRRHACVSRVSLRENSVACVSYGVSCVVCCRAVSCFGEYFFAF